MPDKTHLMGARSGPRLQGFRSRLSHPTRKKPVMSTIEAAGTFVPIPSLREAARLWSHAAYGSGVYGVIRREVPTPIGATRH
jgi:hypothetical protein